jgi:protein-tyrosine phosphatase
MEQTITHSLWWVLPDQLAGVRKPTADELMELRTCGIGALVSVMDDPSNLDLYEHSHLPHLWLPVQGGTAPTAEQIAALSTFVTAQNDQGRAVAVHCSSGRRRTGTFLAAHLIARGQSFEEALQTILTANPQVELRDAQLRFLREFAGE